MYMYCMYVSNMSSNNFREAEIEARNEQSSLRDSIDAAKGNAEKNMMSASMEIARMKDDLLEARRVTRGEEVFVEKLESVRETNQTAAMQQVEEGLTCQKKQT